MNVSSIETADNPQLDDGLLGLQCKFLFLRGNLEGSIFCDVGKAAILQVDWWFIDGAKRTQVSICLPPSHNEAALGMSNLLRQWQSAV